MSGGTIRRLSFLTRVLSLKKGLVSEAHGISRRLPASFPESGPQGKPSGRSRWVFASMATLSTPFAAYSKSPGLTELLRLYVCGLQLRPSVQLSSSRMIANDNEYSPEVDLGAKAPAAADRSLPQWPPCQPRSLLFQGSKPDVTFYGSTVATSTLALRSSCHRRG
jgi:hypothetical protein